MRRTKDCSLFSQDNLALKLKRYEATDSSSSPELPSALSF